MERLPPPQKYCVRRRPTDRKGLPANYNYLIWKQCNYQACSCFARLFFASESRRAPFAIAIPDARHPQGRERK